MDGELRTIFRRFLPMVAWSTIETGGVEPGVPDSNGLYNGIEFWVEMKKTDAWAVEVKPSQVAWHKLRQSKRGRTFFAVRRKNGNEDDLYLLSGSHAARLKESGLRDCPAILKTTGGPAKWSWAAILDALIRRRSEEGGLS
jgi:hypothetical protein